MNTLTFNASARDVIAGNSKIRIAMHGSEIRVRPTARKAGVNLPRGEKLVDLTGNGRATVEGIDLPAGKFGLKADRYGWFALASDITGRVPSVTIAA